MVRVGGMVRLGRMLRLGVKWWDGAAWRSRKVEPKPTVKALDELSVAVFLVTLP